MTAYQLYSRLNVHIGASTEAVKARLLDYADQHVKGGREAITDAHIGAVLAEHEDARSLYDCVTGSI